MKKNNSTHPVAQSILEKINMPNQPCTTKEIQILINQEKITLSPNDTINIREILNDIPENIRAPYGVINVIYNSKQNNISLVLLTKNGTIHLVTKQITDDNIQPEDNCSNLPKQNDLNSFEQALDSFIYYFYTILFKESCPPEKDNFSYTSSILNNFNVSKKYLSPVALMLTLLYITYNNFRQQLNAQLNHTETSIIVFQITVAIFLLQSPILNILSEFIIQIIFLFIEIGTIKINICSQSLDTGTNLFQNAGCFIIQLLFGETSVITIITKVLMIIIGIIISIVFPVQGVFVAITSAISIILLLWIIFWIISFLINIITNVLLQILCVILLLYISPLIMTLWPLETYLRTEFLKPFCRTIINYFFSITITIFISNLMIFMLFNVCQYFSLFAIIGDMFNGESNNMPAFFEILSISFITIINPLDITKIIPVFITTAIVIFAYPKIMNFFLTRLTNISILNINLLNTQILQKNANQITQYAGKKSK